MLPLFRPSEFNMTDLPWHWLLPLALMGIAALFLVIRFPGRRWPLPIAVTAAGAIVSILAGESSALFPILLTGVILAVCAAASGRK
jgi:cytochrome bd-type quinol oxidase subunit 2